ncbi:protein ZNRD2-like [Physella acuta]|uniref:protein ZNRD2-like n=1 Tax=Physella acuta TaxID=109671 RepID=UPI0027DC32C5|nr:protein ZNRD2-like [Physella acuta]XP_059162817.1 protein ZNRD2-like [Physella acuta]XP_059162824.1 protein ZNRD2-like [Physella acuta]
MSMDYDNWQPPSEAEMKLIEARRERSDKISKLMSTYLLKGYKMLATVCSQCETILLQDRQGTQYCVACSELDSDTDKDNPVLNQAAAISMAREIELSSNPTSTTAAREGGGAAKKLQQSGAGRVTDLCGGDSQVYSSFHDVQTLTTPRATGYLGEVIKPEVPEPGRRVDAHTSTSCHHNHSEKRTAETHSDQGPGVGQLCDKIEWAGRELGRTESVEYSIQLCQLIKAAAEAVVAVRSASI